MLFGVIVSGNLRLAATVWGYTLAFAVAGKPWNAYWGLMYSPLLMIGLVCGFHVLKGLFGSASQWAAGICHRP
jgi:hypothetical protein